MLYNIIYLGGDLMRFDYTNAKVDFSNKERID